jgi:cytochrome oxidase assembly protein ShyY1
VYRFLLSPRWLGLATLMWLAAAVMVGLGFWQLHRYHERSTVNARIDAAGRAAPVPLESVLGRPPGAGSAASGGAGSVGPAPAAEVAWARVSVSGRYDPTHEILARGRTVADQVGFEVFTPLVLPDGAAVLIDRGWIPPAEGGAAALPSVPPAPDGPVNVIGRLHEPESRATPAQLINGVLEVRRVAPQRLAGQLPYPIYGGYLTLDAQQPSADTTFVAIPPDHQNAAMNAGYVAQWWLLAMLALIGYGYLAVKEARLRLGPMVLDRLDYADALIRGDLPEAPVSPAV